MSADIYPLLAGAAGGALSLVLARGLASARGQLRRRRRAPCETPDAADGIAHWERTLAQATADRARARAIGLESVNGRDADDVRRDLDGREGEDA